MFMPHKASNKHFCDKYKTRVRVGFGFMRPCYILESIHVEISFLFLILVKHGFFCPKIAFTVLHVHATHMLPTLSSI